MTKAPEKERATSQKSGIGPTTSTSVDRGDGGDDDGEGDDGDDGEGDDDDDGEGVDGDDGVDDRKNAQPLNSGVGPTTTSSADRGPLRVLRGGDEEETQIS